MSENIQYYGLVDSIEHGTLRQAAFDCFPADQLAKLLDHPSSIIDVPTYSIQMKDDDLRKVPGLNSRQLRPSRWYLLTSGANGQPAKKFARIDSDEYESLFISRIDSLHKRRRDIKGLYLLSLMDGIRDTTKDKLVQIFSSLKIEEAAFVAVYKVGQGNCNAVCDNNSAPLLYYDLL